MGGPDRVAEALGPASPLRNLGMEIQRDAGSRLHRQTPDGALVAALGGTQHRAHRSDRRQRPEGSVHDLDADPRRAPGPAVVGLRPEGDAVDWSCLAGAVDPVAHHHWLAPAGGLIRFHGSGIAGALPVTTLTQTLAQLTVVILGVLVLLNLWGISITPILTALGVGGLAVALALQDTLSNLFAGFYIAVSHQVRLGDYIRLNTGEEGYVTDIGWRSTTIRALANNMFLIPNSKLGQAIVTNFYLPDKRVGVSIQIGVAYDADPDRVERVLLEEAQTAAREIPGMLAEPAPGVSLDPGFGDWSLRFTLGYSVQEFADQFRVSPALRKRILKRLRQEKIDMPFPTRTIYMRGQGDS